MAVRYFCDNCGTETRYGDLQVVAIAVPPQSETFDVCPACARHLRDELERCGEAKKEQRALVAAGRDSALPQLRRYTAVLDAWGIRGLVRLTSYAAIFVVFFGLVTLLTSVR